MNHFATTAAAVKVLIDDGFADTKTVAHLLVDETSMLGHRDAVRLFQLAEMNDLKLIFVGDPMQHGAVARGALMRVLKDYGGIRPFKLTEILRQENPGYRAAARLLSEGETLKGLETLDRLGWIREVSDEGLRHASIARAYGAAGSHRVPQYRRHALVPGFWHRNGCAKQLFGNL